MAWAANVRVYGARSICVFCELARAFPGGREKLVEACLSRFHDDVEVGQQPRLADEAEEQFLVVADDGGAETDVEGQDQQADRVGDLMAQQILRRAGTAGLYERTRGDGGRVPGGSDKLSRG